MVAMAWPDRASTMTVREAALALGVTPQRVRMLCKEGRLSARKFGPLWEIASWSVSTYGDRRGPYHPPLGE